MVRTLLIATVLSLLIAPRFLAEDQDPQPPAEGLRPALGKRLDELLSSGDRELIRAVPGFPGERGSWTCLAPAGPQAADACDFGRQLSRMEPCTRPDDCRALDLWVRGFGPPSLQQARPPAEVLRRAIVATRRSPDLAVASEGSEGSGDSEDER